MPLRVSASVRGRARAAGGSQQHGHDEHQLGGEGLVADRLLGAGAVRQHLPPGLADQGVERTAQTTLGVGELGQQQAGRGGPASSPTRWLLAELCSERSRQHARAEASATTTTRRSRSAVSSGLVRSPCSATSTEIIRTPASNAPRHAIPTPTGFRVQPGVELCERLGGQLVPPREREQPRLGQPRQVLETVELPDPLHVGRGRAVSRRRAGTRGQSCPASGSWCQSTGRRGSPRGGRRRRTVRGDALGGRQEVRGRRRARSRRSCPRPRGRAAPDGPSRCGTPPGRAPTTRGGVVGQACAHREALAQRIEARGGRSPPPAGASARRPPPGPSRAAAARTTPAVHRPCARSLPVLVGALVGAWSPWSMPWSMPCGVHTSPATGPSRVPTASLERRGPARRGDVEEWARAVVRTVEPAAPAADRPPPRARDAAHPGPPGRASADEVRAFQERRLRALVRGAAATVAVPPGRGSPSTTSPPPTSAPSRTSRGCRCCAAPTSWRERAVLAYPRRLVWPSRSSGTSGSVVTVYRTPGSSAYELAALQRQWGCSGCPPAPGRLAIRAAGADASQVAAGGPVTREVPGARQLLLSGYDVARAADPARLLAEVRAFAPTPSRGGRPRSPRSPRCCSSAARPCRCGR